MTIVRDMHTEWRTVDGIEYLITLDTGEASYGDDGGRCAFAYSDVARDAEYASYEAFCDDHGPVADRRLAIHLAGHEGWRLTRGGSCMPVLSDEEYAIVREIVATCQGLTQAAGGR